MSNEGDYGEGCLTGALCAALILTILSCTVFDCVPARFHQSLEARCKKICNGEYHEQARMCTCNDGAVYTLGTHARRLNP